MLPNVVITAATVKPIDSPANPGVALLSIAVPISTNINRKVPTISAIIACVYPIPSNGLVAPRPPTVTAAIPSTPANRKLAIEAPTSWATM